MEALAVQTEDIDQYERQKRYDLQTQFAELVDGTMRTDFELRFNGHDLISEDGRSLDETTKDALVEARQIAKQNPELWFEVRRRSFEREEFHELIEMARGKGPNTKIIVSDFPPELIHAKEDVGGYNVTRKQTMLRILTRGTDGNIHMYSRSLDGSNREALEAIYAHLDEQAEPGELLAQRIGVDISPDRQAILVDELTGIYDRSLTTQFGGQWYAGRRPADYRNTYDFVCRQQDLIAECIRLDNLGWLNEKIMYDMSATMNKRYKAEKYETVGAVEHHLLAVYPAVLYQEIELAGAQARSRGESFSACGVTLGAEGASENQLEQAGYGNKAGEDKYGSLKFKCTKGHDNIRPYGKLIDKCQHPGCTGKVKC